MRHVIVGKEDFLYYPQEFMPHQLRSCGPETGHVMLTYIDDLEEDEMACLT